jgi:hypothetical protein
VSIMTEVTYYVALPFVASDDGIAAGEPMECFNPGAAVMRAEALSRITYHYTNEEEGRTLRRYWTTACQSCALEEQVHNRQGAADLTIAARSSP